MVDDLEQRLARYRADLDAAVLADLGRRRPGQADLDHASGHAGSARSDNRHAVTVDLPAAHEAVIHALELTPAPESSGPPHHGIGVRILVVAASAAAVAATSAILITRDDTTAPASVPDPGVTIVGTPPSSIATTSSSTFEAITATTLASVTVDDLLPPADAVPSRPETGELVAAVGKIHDGAWFLYADGRLISIDDRRPDAPGWIEQRLTPDGVERVRSEFLESGLFDPDQQPSEEPSTVEDPGPSLPAIVRDGERLLVASDPTNPPDRSLAACPTEAPGTRCHLIWYLRDLESTLRQDEWADQQLRRYVPSMYAVCFTEAPGADGIAEPLTDLPSVLALLPSPAPALLEGREPARDFFWSPRSCFDVTIYETRALAEAFIVALGTTSHFEGATYGFASGARLKMDSTEVYVDIQIWPLLPDGGLAMWGG